MKVGKCYRCGSIVEPYISKQWFVKKEVAQQAINKVNAGELKFFPNQWLNNYNAWMRDLKDWCISRQLWWGHRIPVWYCECGEKIAAENDNPTCPKCKAIITKQDEDVLDTWFSSGLWAFSTLGWGNEKDGKNAESAEASKTAESTQSTESALFTDSDLSDFYPNSLLITGFDILFFWVARMLLSGESLLGSLPFKDVYLHALVRDEKGQKMSKSKGNVIDPLEMIDTYGADTLRFTLAILCAQGRDVKLSTQSCEISKNFTNKLYNATQFLKMYASQQDEIQGKTFKAFKNLDDIEIKTPLGKYMFVRLQVAIGEVRQALESYRFNDGASILYRFLWGEFCDWGIELTKASKDSVYELGAIFKSALLLLHPYMPFITDWLWHSLNGSEIESADSIMITPYPKAKPISEEFSSIEQTFKVIEDVIVSIRRLKAMLELGNANVEEVFVKLNVSVDKDMLELFVCKLAKVTRLHIVQGKQEGCVCDVSELSESYMNLKGIDLSAIITRLNNQKAKLEKEIAKLQGMLGNENFIKNAPKAVLEQNTQALNLAQEKYAKIQDELKTLLQS